MALYDASIQCPSASPLFVFEGHVGPITAVGFDPTSPPRFVFSASEDKTLQMWKPVPQGVLGALFSKSKDFEGKPHRPDHEDEDMNSDSSRQRTSRSVSLARQHFPEVERGKDALFKWTNDSSINAAVFYAQDEQFITADRSGRIKMWKYGSHSPVRVITPGRPAKHLQTLELSFDNSILVSADTMCNVFLYHMRNVVADQHCLPLVTIPVDSARNYISRTRLSANNRTLACTISTGKVKVFNLPDISGCDTAVDNDKKQELKSLISVRREFVAHASWVWDAVFVGDASNYLFTCSFNAQVMLWDLDSDVSVKSTAEYRPHTKAVVCLAIKEQCEIPLPA